jgi:DNA primase
VSRIPPEVVEQIKLAADITEVVGDFVTLKRKGQNLWAPCPFHDEKTASFSVAPNKGIFKCFGCQKAGDVVRFVMEIEKASYPEALRWLAKRYGITIPESEVPKSDEELAKQQDRDSLFILTDWAKEFFKRQLLESEEGRSIGGSYLRERGIQRPAQDAFDLGYSLDQWEALRIAARAAGFQERFLEEAGLVVVREEQPDRKYDRFRGRVMFPIHNAAGRVVGFGARTLRRDDKAGAKYLNSPESTIYHKGDVLYGLYQAREAIRKDDLCYLVEGYLDVISLSQGGVKNVVAISGTALTESQVRLLTRYTKNVTLLLDGDAAGIRASKRGVDLLLAGGLNVRVCPLPVGEDPDSFIRKQGDTAFRTHLTAHTQDFITFKARAWQQEAGGDPVRKAEAIRDVLTSVARVQDAIKRSVFIQECARLFGLDEQILLTEYNRIAHEVSRSSGPSGGGQRPPTGSALPPAAQGVAGIAPSRRDGPVEEDLSALEAEAMAAGLLDADGQVVGGGGIEEAPFMRYEREVIRLLLNYADRPVVAPDEQTWLLAPYMLSLLEGNGTIFRDPLFARIAGEIRSYLEQDQLPEPMYFISHDDGAIRALAADLLVERWSLSDNWEAHNIVVPREPDVIQAAADQAVLRMSYCLVQDKYLEFGEQLKHATDAEEQIYLIIEAKRLKEVQSQLGKLLGRVVG